MKGFLSNLYLRPSCYKCPTKAGRSTSDLTIGDFWGIHKFKPEFDDDKGVGAILAYTSKGKSILNTIDIDLLQMSYDEVVVGNPVICTSVCMSRKRDLFWKNYFKKQNVKLTIISTLKITFWDRLLVYTNLFKQKISKSSTKKHIL